MIKKIFEYKYSIAMVWPKTIVTILDTEKENLIYTSFIDWYWKEPIIFKSKLKNSKIEELKNLIHNHQEIFSIWKIEANWVCDWCWSEFVISDWRKTVEIEWSNLWYFDHDIDGKSLKEIKKNVTDFHRKEHEVINAKILLKFFYEIKDFLHKAWIPNSYFKY